MSLHSVGLRRSAIAAAAVVGTFWPASPAVAATVSFYNVSGTVSVQKLVKGAAAIRGRFAIGTRVTGGPTGVLLLEPASVRVSSPSAEAITARIEFVPSGDIVGSIGDETLEASTRLRLKVTEARLFGAIPLASTNGCQSRQYSQLRITSDPGFTREFGGSVTGTFDLSDLNGCAAYAGLINPMVAATGNSMKLRLDPTVPWD